MRAKVLILDVDADAYAEHLQTQFPELTLVLARDFPELPADLSDIDVLVGFGVGMSDDIIRRLTGLKWIQSLATGVDYFLRCASLPSGVWLTNTRGIHGAPVRETVVYLMMALQRGAARLAAVQNAHTWDRQPWNLLAGKTAVIAGVGVCGTAIGQLLHAFGMRVIGVTRTPRAIAGFDEALPTERLVEAAGLADYLINILPSNTQNDNIFGGEVFAAMKPTAFFINVGRGQTVDEAAFRAMMRDRRIAGAGLDVFTIEPLPPDSPYWDLPNVVVTPHLGGYINEYEELAMPLIIGNMRLFLADRPQDMRNIVEH
jgi:phosphoglycerate dehydrogenase-like enzyme